MKTSKFTKAWDVLKTQPVDIRDLPRSRNGQNCDCICVECKKPLEACQGYINAWYFRHQVKTDCKGGPMTALHLLAQYLLIGDHVVKTRECTVEYSAGVMEYVLPNSRYEVDVAGLKSDGSSFVIEIFVKHQIEHAKIEFLKTQKIHSIEINLSNVNHEIKREELLKLLLTDVSRQRIIYSPSDSAITVESVEPTKETIKPWYEDLIPIAIFAAIIYGLCRIFRRPKKRKY